MRTLAVASRKGGAGKTTLALHLAVASEAAGRAAVVLDLDPQASATVWRDMRRAETPPVTAIPAARLKHALTTARDPRAHAATIPRRRSRCAGHAPRGNAACCRDPSRPP